MPTPIHLKPPMAAWIVTQRKAKGWKPRDVVERLAALGLVVSEDTVKVWESNANRRPAPENIDGLERIFGSRAPEKDALPPDQSALIALLEKALTRQSLAIEALVQRLDDLATGQAQLALEVGKVVDPEAALRRLEEDRAERPSEPDPPVRAEPKAGK